MYIGARINIYSRLLQVVEFGDVFTKNALEQKKEKTLAIIRPNSYLDIGYIIDIIEQNEFIISKLKLTRMTKDDV